MKRYYLCDMVGDKNSTDPATSYRPLVYDYGARNYVVAAGPDGKALVLVASRDHSAFRGRPGIDPLPEFPLDARMQALTAAAKAGMEGAMRARALPQAAIDTVSNASGYRDVIRAIGQHYNPVFDEDRFDVADV